MSDSSTHHLDACLAVLDRYNKDPQGKLIIDISTDAGVEPEDWRAMALARQNVLDVGGTINVFAVDVNPAEDGFRTLDELVRTGFLMQGTFEEYHQGMLQKMLKELMM